MTTPKPSAEEFARGRWDVVRWARVYLGIRMHPGQARMANAYLRRTDSRWRALYFWIMVSAGNRAGKTLALAIIILHSCVYRMGLKPPDDPSDPAQVEHWGKIPYHWWHFAVQQTPSEQVFRELITILGGMHEAQKTGCPWSVQVGGADKIATATQTDGIEWTNGAKEHGEYAWIKLSPELGGAEIHFRSTKAKALNAIGQNMHGLSLDEAGLQEEPPLQYLLEEIFHARRLGTGGQLILISTPSVATSSEFEDVWMTGDPEDPFQKPRRFSLRMSSRENVGYGLDEESFDALIEGQTDEWIRQNIDGEFIQSQLAWFNSDSVNAAFRDLLPETEEPRRGKIYLHALDPGLKDKCWSMVFKVTGDTEAVGVSLDRVVGKQTTRGIVALGAKYHNRYRMFDPDTGIAAAACETGVDTTALGGHMFRELIEETIPQVRTVEFGGVTQVKRRLLSDVRAALDEGRIQMPTSGYWGEVAKQLKNYKILDRKIEQDLVMSLAIIVKLLRAAPLPAGAPVEKFDYYTDATHDPEAKREDGINSKTIRAKLREQARRRRAIEGRATEHDKKSLIAEKALRMRPGYFASRDDENATLTDDEP